MNKTISTRVGLITGLCILLFSIVIQKMGLPDNSPFILFQFLLLFVGIASSCFLLFRFYAGIKFFDAFTHCGKTLAMIIVIVILGNAALYFLFSGKHTDFSVFTFMIMKTIFSYAISGLLSSFFCSYIFHTFTKK